MKIEEDKETIMKNQEVKKIDIEVPNKDKDMLTNQKVTKTGKQLKYFYFVVFKYQPPTYSLFIVSYSLFPF